ncbi:MAG: asparaginase domain-containing protein [Deltaproteobacteria bacterium]
MKITFIQTGGTIDKDYPKTTKGYAFEITDSAVTRIIEKVNANFEYEIITALKKDSLDITDEDRKLIKKICEESESEKIIITHGTDTMIETANVLSEVTNKTIVLTGAMRPERFYNSDASFNIGLAVGAVNVLDEGIYIAMNGRIYSYDKCSRNMETGQFVGR